MNGMYSETIDWCLKCNLQPHGLCNALANKKQRDAKLSC
jgi:hypothetical protein